MKEDSKTIRVFSGTELEVNLLKGELEQIGISGIIQNDFNSGLAAGFFGGLQSAIDLHIQEFDLKKAGPIIKDFIKRNKE